MALLETEMVRFAESLDDYEHVSVTDMGGWGPDRYWVVVHDHRFDADYEIASHCDYGVIQRTVAAGRTFVEQCEVALVAFLPLSLGLPHEIELLISIRLDRPVHPYTQFRPRALYCIP